MPVAACGEAAPSCEARISPPMATHRPLRMKPIQMTRLERIPFRRAAAGLAPIAYMDRPNTV
jgi:hypothetical protein